MRKIIYIFMFAIVLLIVKAFVLDEYIAEYKRGDANTSAEVNASTEVTQTAAEPEEKGAPQEINVSGMKAEKKSVPKVPENKKMPLDKLGDDLTKHIKL